MGNSLSSTLSERQLGDLSVRLFCRQTSHGTKIKLLSAALCAASALVFSPLPLSADPGRDWRVSDAKGDVQLKPDTGSWRPLKRGETITPGTQIQTGSGGRLILVRPGDSLDIAPNSQFRIPPQTQTRTNIPATHITQSKGTILFRITTRPENPFSVTTPYLAAVIKGTTFTVSVDRDDAALHVSKGAVEVSSILTGQQALVGPGQTAAVNVQTGGSMRLLGFKRTRGKKAGKKGGRGKVTGVIPKTVGSRTVNVDKASRGLVTSGRPSTKGKGSGEDSDSTQSENAGNASIFNGSLNTGIRGTSAPSRAFTGHKTQSMGGSSLVRPSADGTGSGSASGSLGSSSSSGKK
jgi:hypothetical protein